MFKKRWAQYCLLVFVVGGLTYTGTAIDLNKSEWASWVQAVGAIVAIFAAVAISNFQLENQRRLDADREVQEAARLLTFADSVLKNALDAIEEVEKSQRKWAQGSGYIYHEAQQMEAALIMLRTMMQQPLPANIVSSAMLAHTSLLHVDAGSKFLIGTGNFQANSRFDLFWNDRKAESRKIGSAINQAIVIFNSTHGQILVHGTI